MQRTVLFASLVAVWALAFGCERSDQPAEDQAKSLESSAGDQTVEPAHPEAPAPGGEALRMTGGREVRVKEGEQIPQTVEVGCAKCMFRMKGVDSCELAIMIDRKAYLVTGAYVDPVESGLCKAVRKAQVAGRLVHYPEGATVGEQQGEFIAVSIDLQE